MATNNLPTSKASIHGVLLNVLNCGVLITGASGIGKSELALCLIDRGHPLVADDTILLHQTESQQVIGSCPSALQHFLEVRGLGILNIQAMFGDQAIADCAPIELIVKLVIMPEADYANIDRLNGMHYQRKILDINIPEVSIPVAAGRNLSVLLEAAVRNHKLKSNGYDASQDFIRIQQDHMEA